MKIFFNTSTGNCLYVAKKMKSHFENCELLSMAQELKNENFNIDGDLIGFIYPIHCTGVPLVVYDFLNKVKVNKNSYVFAIGVSGGGKADTAFYQTEELIGRKLDSVLEVRYISNYTRSGRNPTEERAKEAIQKYDYKIEQFAEAVKNQEKSAADFRGGIGSIVYKIFKDLLKDKDKKFNVNDKCISCGMCEKICPVDNIVLEGGKPKWNGNCTDCMGCINICPKEAINIGKSTIKKNRYRNPYISSNELISYVGEDKN
ncbi:MAG: EFR1 family ferrodoxin [Clostridium sp.]|nr:EFR1 family ferrodoxin [Clostridium sp.]